MIKLLQLNKKLSYSKIIWEKNILQYNNKLWFKGDHICKSMS